MGKLFSLLLTLPSSITGLHFNLKAALLGLLLCIVHTVVALILISQKYISETLGESILDVSLSATMFIILGLIITLGMKRNRSNVEPPKPNDPEN